MSGALAVASWQESARLPDGPVDLWVALLSDYGGLLGAAPVPGGISMKIDVGRLAVHLPPTGIPVMLAGKTSRGCLIAVAGQAYMPCQVFPLFSDGGSRQVRSGDTVAIEEFVIRMELVPT